MIIFKDIPSIQQFLKGKKCREKKIGFVPTMGALHAGHMSLIAASKSENDFTVCSIFVNPKQFNNPEDLKKYPRDVEKDCRMLKEAGCDVVFLPSEKEIYAGNNNVVTFSFGYLEHLMEGKYRPGHFNGVGIIVTKLFNIVMPDRAYFGQKDLQQFIVISNLVRELSLNVELKCIPIVRESDGLAMSSRNVRLKEGSRPAALIFNRSLREAEELIKNGIPVETVKEKIRKRFADQVKANLEYFEIVNAQDLMPLTGVDPQKKAAVCIAGYVEGIRLIDNIII